MSIYIILFITNYFFIILLNNKELVSSSSSHNITSFESQQSDINNYELDNNFGLNENTILEFENDNVENDNDMIILNEPSPKSSNTTDIFKNIRKFLRT